MMDRPFRVWKFVFSWCVVFALLLVVSGGCATLPPEAVARIRQADVAYRRGAYSDVERLTTDVIVSHPKIADSAEAYYLRGLSRLKAGRRAKARSDFSGGMWIVKRSAIRDRLGVQLGFMDHDDGAYGRAASFLGPVANDPYDDLDGGELMYRYAVALQRSGAFGAARDAYRQVVKEYPRHRRTTDARVKLTWNKPYYTIQCGAFAERSRAEEHAGRVRQTGIEVSVERRKGKTRAPFAVYCGRFSDYPAAEHGLANVRKHQPDAFIVP